MGAFVSKTTAADIAALRADTALLKQSTSSTSVQLTRIVREIELSKQQVTALSQARGSVSLTAAPDHRRRARLVDDGTLSPLQNDQTMQVIFEFVGIKEYLYVAGISRHLRGKYMQFCYNNNTDDQTDKLRTSFTSAVVTGARLQLAFESKLSVSALQADEQRCEADIFSSPSNTRQVLHVARMHGLRWTKTMPAEAALRGQWQLLQWLRMCGCPWDTELILENAVRGGCLQTLRWLKANTRPWTNKTCCGQHAALVKAGLHNGFAMKVRLGRTAFVVELA
jgi:hypothetical protein